MTPPEFNNKEWLLKQIKLYVNHDRIDQVDYDFMMYEINMLKESDLELLLAACSMKDSNNNRTKFQTNPHNSILLYITECTDEFDFTKARSNMIGGSAPDIDIDHDALDREKAIEWCIDYWGKDNVANIITHGTFKPKSLARSYYRITEGSMEDLDNLIKKIPPPKFGKESTLDEILELNPEISGDIKYSKFLEFATKIEDMVSTYGIHAAGVIISDFPIHDVIPLWKNSKADRITQFDKDECEELGLLKFDFLGIDSLSIIKECQKLIKQEKNIDIDPYKIPDGDKLTYEQMNKGHLTGVFQMETSGMAKKLIVECKPESIEDLSAITALNRPGPLQAGFDKQYIENKKNGYAPEELPQSLKHLLEASYWTLLYQEQVMEICSKIAGFTPKEADDVRRAMGKKKHDVLNAYKEQFLSGAVRSNSLTQQYAEKLWEELVGFADYCLSGNTKLKTNRGIMTINQIKNFLFTKEDPLFLYDRNNSLTSILCFQFKGSKPVYRYTLDDGTIIECTQDHKFLTNQMEMLPIEEIYSNNKRELFLTNQEI
jgi:DNA polymerase-3 subunit alpha